jgi:hypothetical protein
MTTEQTKPMGRDWSQLKKPQSGGGDRQEIVRVKLDKDSTKVRIVGNVLPRYVRWVVTNEGKKHPLECISFDRETEEFNNARDPFKDIDEAVFSEKPQFAYVVNVIDRADGRNKLMDLKTTIFKQIIDYARDPDYGSPADADNGYDLTIRKEKTGPLPQNVKYTVMPSRSTVPLSNAERSLELYNLDTIFKRPSYEEQKKWLLDNTAYFSEETAEDLRPSETMEDL